MRVKQCTHLVEDLGLWDMRVKRCPNQPRGICSVLNGEKAVAWARSTFGIAFSPCGCLPGLFCLRFVCTCLRWGTSLKRRGTRGLMPEPFGWHCPRRCRGSQWRQRCLPPGRTKPRPTGKLASLHVQKRPMSTRMSPRGGCFKEGADPPSASRVAERSDSSEMQGRGAADPPLSNLGFTGMHGCWGEEGWTSVDDVVDDDALLVCNLSYEVQVDA